jgi:hypothetical protein
VTRARGLHKLYAHATRPKDADARLLLLANVLARSSIGVIGGEQRGLFFEESHPYAKKPHGQERRVTSSRKRDRRATRGLRLIGARWRDRPPANGNRGEREPSESSPAAHQQAACDRARCQTCHDRESAACRQQARQMWLLGRELCAAAAIFRATGRPLVAAHAIDATCAILRRRRDISDVGRGSN